MIKRTMWKNIWREFRSSVGRFMAIFVITAIGAGFFAGLRATAPDMYATANNYFNDANLADYRLVSTMGFTQADIDALAAQESVGAVMAGQGADFLVETGNETRVARIHSLPINTTKDNEGYLNQLHLTEGRLPEKAGECVVDDQTEYEIGDIISISPDNDETTLELLAARSLTVVGRAASPVYITYQRGSTLIGNGSLSFFIYVSPAAFNSEYYTEIYLTLKTTVELGNFSSENEANSAQSALERFADLREQNRYNEIYSEAREEIDNARAEYEKERGEAERALDSALGQINAGQQEIDANAQKLAGGEAEILAGQKEIDANREVLNQNQAEWNTVNSELGQFETAVAKTPGSVAEMERILPSLIDPNVPNTAELPQFLEHAVTVIATARGAARLIEQAGQEGAEYFSQPAAAAESALSAGDYSAALAALAPFAREPILGAIELIAKEARKELSGAKAELESGWAQLNAAQKQIDDYSAQIADGERQLAAARVELASGRAQYSEKSAEATREFAEAEKELDAAESELSKIEKPEWYIFGRSANPGYSELSSNADRVAAIASVIPVFFYLVAILVCLTTMTRMVEEQRTTIGTFKALGFSPGTIAAKFIIYAGVASVIGSVVGVLIGMYIFPNTIWNTYRIMYNMPPIYFLPNALIAFGSIAAAVTCTIFATFAACRGELKSVPALLMRPKAPRPGKRVLLERVPFIWKRLKFSQKVTVRNLFRYKKRSLMTIVGIAGCAALLLTGFGLRDSINGIVPLQMDEIQKYDMVAVLSKPSDIAEDTPLNNELNHFGEGLYVMMLSLEAKQGRRGNEEIDVYLFVAEQPERLGSFITMQTMRNREPIEFPQGDGAVITEKLAKMLKLGPSDKISVQKSGGETVSLKVVGVMENYVENYVFITPQTYEETFGEPPEYGSLLLTLPKDGLLSEDQTLTALLKTDGVASVIDIETSKQEINDMLTSLDSVVWLIIVSAAALALVVLYNLTNINITERIREIATLKVLGFYDKEVAAYVFRENILLTLIGIVLGFVMGIFLHRFVVTTAEIDELMFRRVVEPLSYLYSVLFTLICTAAVNFIMRPRLRKIDMVESLKSME